MHHQGLYWSNGRKLFRRRQTAAVRWAIWLGFVAAALLGVAGALRFW